MSRNSRRSFTGLAACLLLAALGPTPRAAAAAAGPYGDGLARFKSLTAADRARLEAKAPSGPLEKRELEMSAGGARAAGLMHALEPEDAPRFARPMLERLGAVPPTIGASDVIVHGAGDFGFQSETSIAANGDGSILVAGYNDARGNANGLGVSRSTDGGATWAEVPVGPGGLGVLPTQPGTSFFSDPDVKFDPVNNRFVYAGIYVDASGLAGIAISLSDASGGSWSMPVPATPTFVAGEAADKEFIDVNTVTGRILLTWTDFGASVTIRSTFSDDGGATWAPAVTLATAGTGVVQSSIPRFRPGATNADSRAYVAYRIGNADGSRNIGFVRSLDGGATWSVPIKTTLDYNPEDYIIGNDRVNNSPGLAVDYASGDVYLVYQVNNTVGEGDIAFQRSTDEGASFSPAILIDSNPGADRAQWFPWVTVDQGTGRVHVLWYDQDPEPQGDLTEIMVGSSADGGLSWSRPTPLMQRPFRAGYGNDLGQPNLGDYVGATARGGVLHGLFAASSAVSRFDEAATVSVSLFSPDSYYDQRAESDPVASLRLGDVSFTELCPNANGNLDAGEAATFTLPLENYVGNPNDSPVTYTNVSATLSSTTWGVTILGATQPYPSIAPLAVQPNAVGFVVSLSPGFVPGTKVDLLLTVTTDQGTARLPYVLATGTPVVFTTLLAENFEGLTSIPSSGTGWTATNSAGPFSGAPAGASSPQWTISTTMPGGGASSRMAFHANSTGYKWHRLTSPVGPTVPIPPAGLTSYVQLDFDLAYDTEIEPTLANLAYDGVTLRITDQTGAPSLVRSVLVEAMSEILKTGLGNGFPRIFPRSTTSVPYFQDVACWAGYSNGFVHVTMRFDGPGMAGRRLQLRFEYTEDATGTCSSNGRPAPCGVAVDNVLLRSVLVGNPPGPAVSLAADPPSPTACGQNVQLTATVPATATGTIEFIDVDAASLGAPVPVVAGVAQIVWPAPAPGPHSLVAKYSGDACYAASQSPPLAHQVDPAATTTVLDAQPAATNCGDKVTLTATVSPASATGTVSFFYVPIQLPLTPVLVAPVVDGVATLSVTTLPGGMLSLTAAYGGDACNAASTSAPVPHEVYPNLASTVEVASDVNPATEGAKVNLAASVSPPMDAGVVSFDDGGNPIGQAPVVGGVATLSTTFSGVGPHAITGSYGGGGCALPSTSPVYTQSIVADSPPQVTVTSPNGGENVLVGDPVRLAWTASDDHQIVSVTLSVSRDNGGSWQDVAVDVPNSGTYPWAPEPPGTNIDANPAYTALVRVTAKDDGGNAGTDVSDAPFSIFDQTVEVVVTQLRTDPAEVGVAVTWELANRSLFASLRVERAGVETGPWRAVATDLHDDGTRTVAVDRTAEAGRSYWYRLVATTNAGSQAVFGPVEGTAAAPREFGLGAAWPNPTRGTIAASFAVASPVSLRLSVVDLQGREVQVLARGPYSPGRYRVTWDGRNDRGDRAPAGVYFIRYLTPAKTLVTRFAIVR